MDHASYIDAVVTALADEGIPLTGHQLSAQPRLSATLTADLAELDAGSALAFDDLAALRIDWTEHDGWSVTLTYPPQTGFQPAPIYRGVDVLPTPMVAAAWVALLLTHPEMMQSRDNDLPLRSPIDIDDPVLLAQLAFYDTRTSPPTGHTTREAWSPPTGV